MSASNHTDTAVKQLKVKTKKKLHVRFEVPPTEVPPRSDSLLQLPSLEIECIPSGKLRHERRRISLDSKSMNKPEKSAETEPSTTVKPESQPETKPSKDIKFEPLPEVNPNAGTQLEPLPEAEESTTAEMNCQTDAKPATSKRAGDIYFSPLPLSRRSVCLSDPVLARDSTVLESSTFTKMLVAFPRPPAPVPAKKVRAPLCNIPSDKLVVPANELNGLMVALANCSLVRLSLHEDYPRNIANSRSGSTTPASGSGSGSKGSLYSQPNKQFVTSNSQTIAPSFELTSSTLGAVTIIDATKPEQALQSSSSFSDLKKGTSRSHSHITMSRETNFASALQIMKGKTEHEPVKIALQIMNTGLDLNTSLPVSYISVEHDMTDMFKRAALAELAQHAEVSVDEIIVDSVHNPKSFRARTSPGPDMDDWMLLADELQAIGEITNKVDAVLAKFKHLEAETCTMQTLTLMSELSRTVASSVDSIAIRLTPRPGQRSLAEVVQVSRSISSKLEDMDCYAAKDSPVQSRASRGVLRKICRMVVDFEDQRAAYKVNGVYSLTQMFNNVPLYETAGGAPSIWMVFVQPGFTRWQMI